ncbi:MULTISPECIES: TnsD family Tn7-like transposition protein [Brevibacillus]|uniref:TnsD family Tn7-like transposition protein n=1 Tax=Brevibacillus TaxID=55080 RepID=UPI000EC62455|nr:TnsD family Tn7-like transposition protein [Brevibacillus sp.]HBZ82757.1 hypothetical protein [Brevibacillus sp.]
MAKRKRVISTAQIEKWIKEGRGQGYGQEYIPWLMIQPANGVKNNKFLRYCTMCVDRDRLQYGIAYWHRAHQLPGVTVCHLHSSLLIDSNVPFSSRRNKHEFVSLEEVALPNVPTIRTSTEVKIAKYSYHILNSECDPGSGGTLRIIYLARLQEMGFVSPTGRLRFKLIIQAFINLFGENFLNQIGCNIHPTEQYSWLHKVMRKEHFTMHPLRHILLHIFLGLPTHLSFSKREGVLQIKTTKKQQQRLLADETIRNLRSQPRKRVDWEQRDNIIAEKVHSVAEQLYTIKNMRISKSEIGRKIGALSLIHNKLGKLPKTSKELSKYVESTEEFRKRRISMAMNESEFARTTRPAWKIAKEAGISLKEFRRLMNVSKTSGNGA